MLAFSTVRDLIPLLPVFPLLFAAHGLSDEAISGLFVLWSVVTLVAEVPSGVWADTIPRRTLLLISGLIYAGCWACWTLGDSFPVFAVGFACWGLSDALLSGTYEALVYDELAAARATARYPAVIGASESLALVANLTATLAAAPLLALGGFRLVGVLSIGIAVLHAGLALTFPRVARTATEGFRARYLAMLRSGVAELGLTRKPRGGSARVLRAAVLIAALILAFEVYDEYFPLLAAHRNAHLATVPLLIALMVVAQAVGAALAGRTGRWSGRTIAIALIVAAALLATGALLPGVWPAFLVLAGGYGLVANLMVITEARVQSFITGPARATVTSVISLLTHLLEIGLYAAVGVAAGVLELPLVLAALSALLLPVAVLAWCRLPSAPE